jgi:flagellar FliL protein
MADATTAELPTGKRPMGKMPLILGAVLALLGAGGAFYVTWSGVLAGSQSTTVPEAGALPDIAFVPIDPVVVSIPGSSGMRQLRFTSQIEADAIHAAEVAQLMPRILDVMNSYMRAVEPVRFEEPGALMRIRSQLLRRIQIVTGEGRVRDLLVTEFIMQ